MYSLKLNQGGSKIHFPTKMVSGGRNVDERYASHGGGSEKREPYVVTEMPYHAQTYMMYVLQFLLFSLNGARSTN